MLKLAKLTDYATVVMTAIAAEPAQLHSAQELADRSHLPAATVSKLLKMLAKARLIEATRGAQGGYRLMRSPESITVADVVDAVEGPIAVTSCSIHAGDCSIESSCGTRANWRLINEAIRQALAAVTLAQIAAPMRRAGTMPAENPITFHPRKAKRNSDAPIPATRPAAD
ncbi:transcriptional regulator, BadM/Rrf2 family [Hydrocarboniphaga daqingensis]|jgi:FeS assembly SUF system regulator|uniref:Transcriptional regulator, BadM/Rrf2 family n=1 Tax=Hydrocarboniphaga daqingensis TaxID=490188 RepID=A0A1M5RUH5_9GAMM|nr:SUF system Fe-S cluster assembly regulator [Hydrocarboniphaga daqingensis]SHH29955.1 transcriptional regulator, BadM/Rrf2 family [Hydrocarboniphaga daqingensis]